MKKIKLNRIITSLDRLPRAARIDVAALAMTSSVQLSFRGASEASDVGIYPVNNFKRV